MTFPKKAVTPIRIFDELLAEKSFSTSWILWYIAFSVIIKSSLTLHKHYSSSFQFFTQRWTSLIHRNPPLMNIETALNRACSLRLLNQRWTALENVLSLKQRRSALIISGTSTLECIGKCLLWNFKHHMFTSNTWKKNSVRFSKLLKIFCQTPKKLKPQKCSYWDKQMMREMLCQYCFLLFCSLIGKK